MHVHSLYLIYVVRDRAAKWLPLVFSVNLRGVQK